MHAMALQFFSHCQSEPDTDRVIARFMDAIGSYGFEVATAGAWVGVGAARAHRFYFNNWPQDWLDLYNERNFFRDDPMVLETHRRMTPFLWSEMHASRSFTSIGAEVARAAAEYGWVEVMGVPIHGPASYQGLVSFAARRPLQLDATDRAMLRALANAIHDRLHESAGMGQASQPEVQLTTREAECMRWAAAGKTDAEIAAILGIAPPTVHYHVERVKKKFRTGSRTEAVAYLVLAGTI